MASSPTVLAGQDLPASLLGVPAFTTMTSTGYSNSWSDFGAPNTVGQYRLWPLINEVEIIGTIQHTSITGTSVFITLPAGFRPATTQLAAVWTSGTSQIGSVTVDGTGALTANGLSATTNISFHGWFSLDA